MQGHTKKSLLLQEPTHGFYEPDAALRNSELDLNQDEPEVMEAAEDPEAMDSESAQAADDDFEEFDENDFAIDDMDLGAFISQPAIHHQPDEPRDQEVAVDKSKLALIKSKLSKQSPAPS